MRFLGFFFLFFILSVGLRAENTFHPEKDAVVYSEKFWAEVNFKGDNTAVTQFRVIYEAPAATVFEHLIDTNSLKKYHDNYADSRTLSLAHFNLILEKKPATYQELIEDIGDAKRTNSENRQVGKDWTDYWYMRFNLPWPFTDKWVVQKAKIDESESSKGYYRVEYKLEHGNIKNLKGWWEVVAVPEKPQWSEFRGETESDPGVTLPQFLAKNIFKSTLSKEAATNAAFFKKNVPSSQ